MKYIQLILPGFLGHVAKPFWYPKEDGEKIVPKSEPSIHIVVEGLADVRYGVAVDKD